MDFDALERLGRLRASGAISDAEFESEKNRILGVVPNLTVQPTGSLDELPFSEWDPVEQAPPKSGNALMVTLGVVLLGVGGIVSYRYLLPHVLPLLGAKGPETNYVLGSNISGIRIAPTTQLPRNPHGDDPSCETYEVKPISKGAQQVASQGWHVTQENSIGQLVAVSFAGACDPISASDFRSIDANVGMYDDQNLKAVAYGKRLGRLRASRTDNELYVLDARNGENAGRIRVDEDHISIVN